MKPLFCADDYDLNTAMHCKTEEEAQIFLDYLDSVGKRWSSGDSYLDKTLWEYGGQTCYYFNQGCVGRIETLLRNKRLILEFDDFNWSNNDEYREVDISYDDLMAVNQ